MTRPNRHNAFTLLEVVLAISLTLVVTGGAMGFYRHVAKTRDRVLADAEFTRTVRLVMDRMTVELQCIRADAKLQPLLVWNDGEIQFTTVTLPSAAAWAIADRTDEPILPTHDMRLVIYALENVENEDGEMENLGLKRVVQAVLSVPDPDEDSDVEDVETSWTQRLAPAIQFLRFRYYTGDDLADEGEVAGGIVDEGWVEIWDRRELPGAVEITLGAHPIDEDQDVDEYLDMYETFRRVVFLPASRIRAAGQTEE